MVIKHALLALLTDGPKHGFQLAQEFEAGTGDMWPLNTGQVYTTLRRLERDELVESDESVGDGQQNRYQITVAGREELNTWLRTPPDTQRPPRDELVVKVLVASRMSDVDVTELVQSYRRQMVEAMQQYTRLKDDAPDDDIGLLLIADAELYRLDSVVRWLDAAESRLRRLGPPSVRLGAAAPASRRRAGAPR